MTDMQRYVVEEWAEEYRQGRLARREFLRRMTLMCGGVALAVPALRSLGVTATDAEVVAAASTESPVVAQAPRERHVETMNAAVRYLQGLPSVRRDRVGSMGFCFGGGIVWRLATAHPDLRAAVPFYGANPSIADVPRIKAAVLAIYGELDTRINAGIPEIREAMQKARIVHDIVIYPGAQHAFFNDTSAERYNDVAAKAAWIRTLGWFDRYLKAA